MTDLTSHTVKSAQRVLEVLEFFSEDRPSASVTDISRALNYPQSSTSVLLKCLRQLGYLYYDRINRKYRLTARAALIGCWAEQGNYRGGPALDMLDAVAQRTLQTVVLSMAEADYALHHLHVRRGISPDAAEVAKGDVASLMHNVQGELWLASYPDENIRLALHRLNAEEADPGKRVNIVEKLEEYHVMRGRKWSVGPHAGAQGLSAVAALLPRQRRGDRVVISVVASDETVARDGSKILRILLEERDRHFASRPNGDWREMQPRSNIRPMLTTVPKRLRA